MAELFGKRYNYYDAPANAGTLLAEGILHELEPYNGTQQWVEKCQQWFENEYRPWFFEREGFLEPLLENGTSEEKEEVQFFLIFGHRLMNLSSGEAAQKIAKWDSCQDLAAILTGVFCHSVPSIAYEREPETGLPLPCCNLPHLGCRYTGQRFGGNRTTVCDKALLLERKKIPNHARQ